MIDWIEWVGHAASIFIVISLLMKSIIRLRIFNTIGCILFVIYGAIIGAYPVLISNAAIVIINSYYIYKIYTGENKAEG